MLRNTDIERKSMSVRARLSLLMFAVIIFSVCFMACINWLFLGKYYQYKTVNTYESSYYKIKEFLNDKDLSKLKAVQELDYIVKEISDKTNCSVSLSYITDDKGYFPFAAGSQSVSYLNTKLMNYRKDIMPEDYSIYKKIDDAQIQIVHDKHGELRGDTWVEMWGQIGDNVIFIFSANYEDILKFANTSTQFVIIVGFLCALLSMVIAYIFARRFSKPIQDINKLTKNIANMNFNAKYTGDSYLEINELGYSINQMSKSIQDFIHELKTKNTELKHDVIKREEIDDMRKEFISNVSHELKTPIALIMGYAEGLKIGINDTAPEDREFYCDVIIDESKRMNKMVKNLLMLNELEFGKPDYYIEKFDIVNFVINILDSYTIILENKGINVEIKCENESIDVWTDAGKMETVIRNFITNAINHVDDNKKIEIKFTINKQSKRVRIAVFNTGKPIEQSVKSRIWDKFYKVDKARTRDYGGNGVGLSIVKAILEPLKRPYGCVNRTNGVEFFFELDTTDTLVKKFNK